MGYRDNSPVLGSNDKILRQINYMCENNSAIGIICYIIPYYTKKSFLYESYKEDLAYGDYSYAFERLKNLISFIDYSHNGRVGVVGWEAVYTKVPEKFSKLERKKIVFDLFKRLGDWLKHGDKQFQPNPYDVLSCRPQGPKVEEGFTADSMFRGSMQRAKIAQKYGFSDIKNDGCQYAIYDKDLKLSPT